MGEKLVVTTHIPDKNDIPYKRFMTIMKALIGAIYPDRIDDIQFVIGRVKPKGNSVTIDAGLNRRTNTHLGYLLKQSFGQEFEVRSTWYVELSIDTAIARQVAINEAYRNLS